MGTELLSIAQVSKRLGIARASVSDMINRDQLRPVHVGSHIKVPAWQVDNILLGYAVSDGPARCIKCVCNEWNISHERNAP